MTGRRTSFACNHLSLLQPAQAATARVAMFALVLVIDALSSRLHGGIPPAA